MRNNIMTGPIFLSAQDSMQIRQNILNPSEEYIRDRNEYFDRLSSCMVIRTEGTNTTVEFEDLDLSELDAILDEESTVEQVRTFERTSSYISTAAGVSFVSKHQRTALLGEATFLDISSDVTSIRYSYDKIKKESDIQDCNLSDAA